MNSTTIVVLLSLSFAILSAVIAIRFFATTRKQTFKMPRGSLGNGFQIISQQVFLLAIIILAGVLTGIDLFDLGVSKTVNPVLAFLGGFLVYCVVLALMELSAHLLGVRERLHDLSYETMRLIWPRSRNQKLLAVVAVCLINPFTEEVIYRGVLVKLFGDMIGSFWTAAAIGFVLSIAAHLYQGSWSIPFQMLFHCVAILLLYSPLGLVACFGFHFAGDLVPVATMRTNMIAWRDRRRKERIRGFGNPLTG